MSASSATDPVARTSSTWTNAVTIKAASEILTARKPRSLACRAVSALSAASWLWGRKISAIAARHREPLVCS